MNKQINYKTNQPLGRFKDKYIAYMQQNYTKFFKKQPFLIVFQENNRF